MIFAKLSHYIRAIILKALPYFPFGVEVVKKYRNIKGQKVAPNVAESSKEIFKIVSSISTDIFPMFGTLLSIYRDKQVIYADDFDFATHKKELMSSETIQKFFEQGANLCGYSVVNGQLIELSFEKNGVKIDLFYLPIENEKVVHICPNFRKEKGEIKFEGRYKIQSFHTYFKVTYPRFQLVESYLPEVWSGNMPNLCEDIFIRHYGDDWEIPKTSNFIDFKYYQFFDGVSETVTGDVKLKVKNLLCH